MSRAKWRQETRQMQFEDIYEKWSVKCLTQEEGAQPVRRMCDNVIRHLPRWMAVNGGMRYDSTALRVIYLS